MAGIFQLERDVIMDLWNNTERRQDVRYEVSLSVITRHGLMGNTVMTTSHDLSSKGVGLVVDRPLTPGETIESVFVMPDNGEQIHAQGKVVWVTAIGPNRYRAGVVFANADLRPIPIVMRSIKARSSRYNC